MLPWVWCNQPAGAGPGGAGQRPRAGFQHAAVPGPHPGSTAGRCRPRGGAAAGPGEPACLCLAGVKNLFPIRIFTAIPPAETGELAAHSLLVDPLVLLTGPGFVTDPGFLRQSCCLLASWTAAAPVAPTSAGAAAAEDMQRARFLWCSESRPNRASALFSSQAAYVCRLSPSSCTTPNPKP